VLAYLLESNSSDAGAAAVTMDPSAGRTFDWLKQLMVTVVVHLHASASSKVDGDSTCVR
jgi:hypothetical protein